MMQSERNFLLTMVAAGGFVSAVEIAVEAAVDKGILAQATVDKAHLWAAAASLAVSGVAAATAFASSRLSRARLGLQHARHG